MFGTRFSGRGSIATTTAALAATAVMLIASGCQSERADNAPHHIGWGAYLPDLNGSDVDSDAGVVGVSTRANQSLDYILTFAALSDPVPHQDLDRIGAAGATPIVTIEPWRAGGGADQPDYRLSTIAAGQHDSDLHRWADAIRDWGRPVLIRFAHEMNGTWYPWGTSVNGNTDAAYTSAWIHMHDVFTAAGAKNVSFVWSPMSAVAGIARFDTSYPGSRYVDYLGLDGYNWGNDGQHAWASPQYIFGDSLKHLHALDASKPILLAEIGSADDPDPARKAAWISSFVSLATTSPRVQGFIWFQANKERDWRFNSTPQSESAFRTALAGVPAAD